MDPRHSQLLSASTSSENGASGGGGGSSESGHGGGDERILIRWSAPSASAAAQAATSTAVHGRSAWPRCGRDTCSKKAGIVTAITLSVLLLCVSLGVSLGMGAERSDQAAQEAGDIQATVDLRMVMSTAAGLPPSAVMIALRCDLAAATGSSVQSVQLDSFALRDGSSLRADTSQRTAAAWKAWNDPAIVCPASTPGMRLLPQSDAASTRERRLAPSARDIISVGVSLAYPAHRVRAALTQPSTGTAAVILALVIQRDITAAYPSSFAATLRALRRAPAVLVDPYPTPMPTTNGFTITTDAVVEALQMEVQEVSVDLPPSLQSLSSSGSSSDSRSVNFWRSGKNQGSASPSAAPSASRLPSPSSTRLPSTPTSTGAAASRSPLPTSGSSATSPVVPVVPSLPPTSTSTASITASSTASRSASSSSSAGASSALPTSSATSSASNPSGPVSWQQDMLARVNAVRSAAGVGPVTLCTRLTTAAQGYADQMSRTNTFSHTGADGSTPASRVDATGYVWMAIAENIAKGQGDVASVMSAWQGSSGHYANMVGRAYTHVGLGMTASGGPYWVQKYAAGGDCGGLGGGSSNGEASDPILDKPGPASGYRRRSGRTSGRTNGVAWWISWWTADRTA